jgi:hypothetical protein
MLSALLGVALAVALLALFWVARAAARDARALGETVHGQIEPFLRRKAAQIGLVAEAPTFTRRSRPQEIVAYSARLAVRLNDRERGATPTGDSLELGPTRPINP